MSVLMVLLFLAFSHFIFLLYTVKHTFDGHFILAILAEKNNHNAGLPWSGKNIWKMNFFQLREKLGNFVDGQGNLERPWKVWEKSGNLKINSYGRQSSENLFKRVKDVLSSLGPFSSSLGATLIGKNLLCIP